VQYVVLNSINMMVQEKPLMFKPFLSDFFVKSTDPIFNRLLKLEIIAALSTKENTAMILSELQIYLKDSNPKFVCSAIKAAGKIADADPNVSNVCMEGIMHLLLCIKIPMVTAECVVVLRQLIQQNYTTHSKTTTKVLQQLAKLLLIENGIEESIARSSIVWLVGEYHALLAKATPDILRILSTGFIDESTDTRAQIVNFAVKLALHLPDNENVQLLTTYVLEMARYDLDPDLRDRSRFLTALMGLAPSNDADDGAGIDEDALAELSDHAHGIMLATKLPPVTLLGAVDIEGLQTFNIGSLSSIVGHYVHGYAPIPSWPATQPDPNVRDAKRYDVVDNERFDLQGLHENPFVKDGVGTKKSDKKLENTSDSEDSSVQKNAKDFFKSTASSSSESSSSASDGSSD
jgi:AP-3 complex subunit beta